MRDEVEQRIAQIKERMKWIRTCPKSVEADVDWLLSQLEARDKRIEELKARNEKLNGEIEEMQS